MPDSSSQEHKLLADWRDYGDMRHKNVVLVPHHTRTSAKLVYIESTP